MVQTVKDSLHPLCIYKSLLLACCHSFIRLICKVYCSYLFCLIVMSCVCVLKLCSLKKKQPHISDADCDVYCGQNAIFILAKKSFPYFVSSHIQNLLRAWSCTLCNQYYQSIININRKIKIFLESFTSKQETFIYFW